MSQRKKFMKRSIVYQRDRAIKISFASEHIVKAFPKNYVYSVHLETTHRSWTIEKRYKQFRELHVKLQKELEILDKQNNNNSAPKANELPAFPKPAVFGNLNQKFIENRKNILQYYTQAILDSPVLILLPLVTSFFSIPENYKEPPSQDELRSANTSPVEIAADNDFLDIPRNVAEKSQSWDERNKEAEVIKREQLAALRGGISSSSALLSKSAEVVKTTSIAEDSLDHEIDDEEEEEDFAGQHQRFEVPYMLTKTRENVRDSLAIELNEDEQPEIVVGTMVVTQLSQLDFDEDYGSVQSTTTKSLHSSSSQSMKSTFAVGSIPRQSKKSFKNLE